VDRDDLRDGGAQHFVDCIRAVRGHSPQTQIEVLVPDFRGRLDRALDVLTESPPDVMNHNLETVPRLYRQARPGSDYAHSLRLLQEFKQRFPDIPTKSGLMVGLGETDGEILDVMRDMRAHGIEMLTIGQYLQPTTGHLPVLRYVHPDVFTMFGREAYAMGFRHAAVGALVRSSYHADQQAEEVLAEAAPTSGELSG
jgi:lipoic acid synthetase